MKDVKTRRPRSDSAQALVNAHASNQVAQFPPEVPHHPDPERAQLENRLFELIVQERRFADWSPYSLVTAARLACSTAAIILEEALLNKVGVIIKKPTGGVGRNVLLDAIQSRQASITQLSRQLQINVAPSDARSFKSHAQIDIGSVADKMLDDLLARRT